MLWVAAFTTLATHHPSMSLPTVFLRTNSLPSTASLTLPSLSLPPPLHFPSARHSDRSDGARRASPKSRSNEATGYLVDLIYAPFIIIVEKKKRKKKESWALASARATRRCSNSDMQPSTLPSVRMQSMHRTGTTYTRTCMHSSATYMRIGRASMPLVAALAYHRAPTCQSLRAESIAVCMQRWSFRRHSLSWETSFDWSEMKVRALPGVSPHPAVRTLPGFQIKWTQPDFSWFFMRTIPAAENRGGFQQSLAFTAEHYTRMHTVASWPDLDSGRREVAVRRWQKPITANTKPEQPKR